MITNRDKALFESGVKLGALYHQFVGSPISEKTAESLEEAIKNSVLLQPFVESVKVKIDREMVTERLNNFGYCELDGKMLSVELLIRIGSVNVKARLEYDRGLDYPLMFLEEVQG